MKIFNKYADYYDLLYADKNYQLESNFIINKIKNYKKNPNIILNFGCGTGNHDKYLVKISPIVGIDISKEMITLSKKKNKNISYFVGNIKSYIHNKKVDVVLALFHVMSYLTTIEDFKKALETVNNNLLDDGIFMFDFWYGPAVLYQKPEKKVKRVKNEFFEITRFTEPELYPNENIVRVNFDVFVLEKETENISHIKEIHNMRYYFYDELVRLLKEYNFKILEFNPWLDFGKLGFESWSAFIIAQK